MDPDPGGEDKADPKCSIFLIDTRIRNTELGLHLYENPNIIILDPHPHRDLKNIAALINFLVKHSNFSWFRDLLYFIDRSASLCTLPIQAYFL